LLCEVWNPAFVEISSCCATKERSKSAAEAKTDSSNSVAKFESSKVNGSNLSAEPFPLEEGKAGVGRLGVVAFSMNQLALLVL
jgi:hypothetical protein